jgi:hypothetical protein
MELRKGGKGSPLRGALALSVIPAGGPHAQAVPAPSVLFADQTRRALALVYAARATEVLGRRVIPPAFIPN